MSAEDLESMHLLVSGELRRYAKNDPPGKPKSPIWITVDARILSPLLFELRERRPKKSETGGRFSLGPVAKTLIGMKVGETATFPANTTKEMLTTARTTARKHLEQTDARWESERKDDGTVLVTRLPDGASYTYGKGRNPSAGWMAKMGVGDQIILTCKVTHALKVQAREIMKNPEAQWRAETLTSGKSRVRRTK